MRGDLVVKLVVQHKSMPGGLVVTLVVKLVTLVVVTLVKLVTLVVVTLVKLVTLVVVTLVQLVTLAGYARRLRKFPDYASRLALYY
jgi:hypothetical protein